MKNNKTLQTRLISARVLLVFAMALVIFSSAFLSPVRTVNAGRSFPGNSRTTVGPGISSVSTTIVISQVYGGGGNSGATLTNDFIELFNRGNTAVSLNGWSVQYASSAGTTWAVTPLTNVMLQPGQYYLVQEAAGAGGTTPLPLPDATGTTAMSATTAKVALVNTTVALSGTCPAGASLVDLIGYGGASCLAAIPNSTKTEM